MPEAVSREVTQLLQEVGQGDKSAFQRLIPLVYGALRNQAARYLSQERSSHTLQPTALVHEAYVRLMQGARTEWNDRKHFVGCAAMAMRSILVDYARASKAAKRGGGRQRVTLRETLDGRVDDPHGVIAIDEALTRLADVQPEAARVVEARFFGGFTLDEIAEAMGVSRASVSRYWQYARLWLHREIAA